MEEQEWIAVQERLKKKLVVYPDDDKSLLSINYIGGLDIS